MTTLSFTFQVTGLATVNQLALTNMDKIIKEFTNEPSQAMKKPSYKATWKSRATMTREEIPVIIHCCQTGEEQVISVTEGS